MNRFPVFDSRNLILLLSMLKTEFVLFTSPCFVLFANMILNAASLASRRKNYAPVRQLKEELQICLAKRMLMKKCHR